MFLLFFFPGYPSFGLYFTNGFSWKADLRKTKGREGIGRRGVLYLEIKSVLIYNREHNLWGKMKTYSFFFFF